MAIANVYAMNTTDVERIKLLEETHVQIPGDRTLVDVVVINGMPESKESRRMQGPSHGTASCGRVLYPVCR